MTLIKNNPNMASGWEPYLQISHYKGFNYKVCEKEPTLRGSLIDKVYNLQWKASVAEALWPQTWICQARR